MANISFYHTTGETPATLDAMLPPLLEKALRGNNRILILAPTAARRARLDEALWTYAEASFLPHATLDDPFPDNQPILLATPDCNWQPHLSGRIPLLLSGAENVLEIVLTAAPQRLLYMFTAAQPDVERARPLFKSLKTQGHALTYHQQTPTGWQQK